MNHEGFRKTARVIATAIGTPIAFLMSLLFVVGWAVTGPVFGFSDTWQLIINTSTTVVTFLMVFIIQNSQNRDTKATQLKLDELLRAIADARSSLINVESLSDAEMEALQKQFEAVRARAAALDKPL